LEYVCMLSYFFALLIFMHFHTCGKYILKLWCLKNEDLKDTFEGEHRKKS
jgi:hypothetical protein